MERIEGACPVNILLTWGLYSLAVAILSNYLSHAGWTPAAIWSLAAVAGFGLLAWTREI